MQNYIDLLAIGIVQNTQKRSKFKKMGPTNEFRILWLEVYYFLGVFGAQQLFDSPIDTFQNV